MINNAPNRILISRTDSIGDVVLNLPVSGILKQIFPESKLFFLGKDYTRPVIESCEYIHKFISWDTWQSMDEAAAIADLKKLNIEVIIHAFPRPEIARLAKKAGIPHRIGTTGRAYHLTTVNHPVLFSRKRSDLHEAQLNLKLLKPLGWDKGLAPTELYPFFGMTRFQKPKGDLQRLINPKKFNLIIHPKSKGSAREWGIDNFNDLIDLLPHDLFEIFVTGTLDEGTLIQDDLLNKHQHIHDLTGKLNLDQLISFISIADGLLASSTGPLHLAAALGIYAIGLYPPIRPMHPGRWAPIGPKASFLVKNAPCSDCRKTNKCHCLEEISPGEVADYLLKKTNG